MAQKSKDPREMTTLERLKSIEVEMHVRSEKCVKAFDTTSSISDLRTAGYIARVCMQAARDRIRYHASKESE